LIRGRPSSADLGLIPEIDGATGWLNSDPLTNESLRGKVVLVNIWTYTCINSLRELPYMKGWDVKYREAGLVVLGVHSPEFSFEKEIENVERAIREQGIRYPVAVDSNFGIWRVFDNHYWPADYYIDGKGRIRYRHFGEGDYEECERVIRELLIENGANLPDQSTITNAADGIQAAPSGDIGSPETYVGYRMAERFALPGRLVRDEPNVYTPPPRPSLNQWGLSGLWTIGGESGELQQAPGKIIFRFHSRDLHLVLTLGKKDEPIRYGVMLDGAAPGESHGDDTSPDGAGAVSEPRLYQLIRQKGPVDDRTFEIEFLDPGVMVVVFTFG
jgi:thiol-disulfide isomerase/thioredoxin